MYDRGHMEGAPHDTLIAQDLQLTSSESSNDLLDHEGGELMDDSAINTTASGAVVAANEEEEASRSPSRYSVRYSPCSSTYFI